MIIPGVFLSWIRADDFDAERQEILQQAVNWQSLTLQTKDKVKIDAVKWIHPNQKMISPQAQTWILWLNPNSAMYEELFGFLEFYGASLNANVLTFNYRGVGKSHSCPHTAEDLIADGEAAMNYLLSSGVKSKNVLIHGHSLGGAVGAYLRRLYPDVFIFSVILIDLH